MAKGKLDWWRGAPWKWRGVDCCSRHGDVARARRRNRAWHVELTRAEVDEALSKPHFLFAFEIFAEKREHFDMNDEYQCPSTEVWRALCEDEMALATIDFNGTYTTESER